MIKVRMDLRKELIEDHFDTEPVIGFDFNVLDYDPFEPVGGHFKNYMGVKEKAELPRCLWVYYEWVKPYKNLDVRIMRNDRIRGETSFSEMIEGVIFDTFLMCEAMGMDHPPGIVAVDPETEEDLERPVLTEQ